MEESRMRTTLRRGALLVATALLALVGVDALAQVAYTANTVTSVYYREFKKDDRYYVFNTPAAAEAFEKSGETGTGLKRIGIGPNGETVFAENETALELFIFKYNLSEAVERPKPPALNIVWRDGKTRMTIGSNFYLEMSNRIQVRYTHEFPDDSVKLQGTESAGDSRGSFRIRRAKLKFEGWFYQPWLQYEVQTNWPGISSANLGNYLEDANINWDVTKGKKQFMVKIGQYKVPFGLQELTSSGSQQFVDRSFTSNFYFRGRDTGATVWGVLGNNKFEYRAGLFNGNGLTRSANDNDKFQYNARVTFQPNGAVPLGTYSGAHQSESDFETRALGKPIFTVSAAFEQNDLSFVNSDQKTNIRSTLWEVDAMFKYRGFSATGAYIWGKRKPQAGAVEFDTSGWYAQAGYFLKPEKWEIAARYGETDPSDLVGPDKVKELRGGLNFFYARHALKVQADFARIETESSTGGTKNNELRIQTQFIF
jgi:phosphate-selective porin OprO and OprP